MEVHILFKFVPNPYGGEEVDTTSGSGLYRDLSPFVLGPIKTDSSLWPAAYNFENLWQFSKVYKQHVDTDGLPTQDWIAWRNKGWANPRAVRYPMGKGAIPEYSYWQGEKLGYIDARKRIYAPIYAKYVVKTDSFRRLVDIYKSGEIVILRDYDAYDHIKLGMTLVDVINNPSRKMGHAFVLAMILTGVLDECLR